MFFVGDTSQAATYYWESVRKGNPILPDVHWEEMSEAQLRRALTFCRMAYYRAVEDNCFGEALNPLYEPLKEVAEALCAISPQFKSYILGDGMTLYPSELVKALASED